MPPKLPKSSKSSKRRKITHNGVNEDVLSVDTKKKVKRHYTQQRKRLPKGAAEYVYEPLTSPTSIRILKLLPGTKGDLIQCRLKITTMAEVRPYEAMSYVWGDTKDKREICCGGRKAKIPTNLRDALRRIRDPFEVKYVWADSICINQLDEKERGHQVRQMASIYSSAERVIVWLGSKDPFDGFDRSIRPQDISTLIESFCERINCSHKVASPTGAATTQSSCKITPPPRCTAVTHRDLDSHHFLRAWGNLLRRPWFDRLWVVQEAGLAKSVLALFGDDQEIDFDNLICLTHAFEDKNPVFALDYGITVSEIFLPFLESRTIAQSPSLDQSDFIDMLYHTRRQFVTKPVDSIFALLGHPSAYGFPSPPGRDGLIIEPDYQKSHLQTYHELAITLLQESKNLRVLSAVHHPNENSLTREYPSWIPTWDRKKTTSIGVLRSECDHGMDAHAGFLRSVQCTTSSNILQVQGFAFDTIDECTTEFQFRPKGQEYPTGLQWPVAATMTWRAFSMMSAQEKLYELATALMCGWEGYEYSSTEQGLRDFAAFRAQMLTRTCDPEDAMTRELLPEGSVAAEEAAEGGDPRSFLAHSEWCISEKRLFSTRSGLIGTGPIVLRPGDICCILFGGHTPFILRRTGSTYRLVGAAYIRKVMQGEAVVDLELGGKYQIETFHIS
jgi:hypothetical protein